MALSACKCPPTACATCAGTAHYKVGKLSEGKRDIRRSPAIDAQRSRIGSALRSIATCDEVVAGAPCNPSRKQNVAFGSDSTVRQCGRHVRSTLDRYRMLQRGLRRFGPITEGGSSFDHHCRRGQAVLGRSLQSQIGVQFDCHKAHLRLPI